MCAASLTNASEQYSRILLTPYYKASTTANTPTLYSVSIDDSSQSIKSGIVSFDAYMNPTITFSLKANNKSCNTSSYTISTTYSGASQARISFDCSQQLIRGNNALSLVADKNTGAIIGFADVLFEPLTQGVVSVKGTEYVVGDSGTVFAQVVNSLGQPVNNASCNLDVYAPLLGGIHPKIINNAPMLLVSNDSGLYYYDLLPVPSALGVYMVSVGCYYQTILTQFFPQNEVMFFPQIVPETGTWSTNYFALNSLQDSQWVSAQLGGGATVIANVSFNMSAYGALTNISQLSLFFVGQASKDGFIRFAYWNGTGFQNLSSNLTYIGTGTTNPDGYGDQFYSANLPVSAIINNTVRLRMHEKGTQVQWFFANWMMLAVNSNLSQLVSVRGNGELHVRNATNTSCTLGNITFNLSCPSTNLSINLSCPQTNITLLCNLTEINFSACNFSGINYSLINASCAGFFQNNGGETMWTFLIIIIVFMFLAEITRSNWIRMGNMISIMLFVSQYYAQEWFSVGVILGSMYALYAILMFTKAEGWSVSR